MEPVAIDWIGVLMAIISAFFSPLIGVLVGPLLTAFGIGGGGP